MKKEMTRIIGIIVCLVLVFTIFSACGEKTYYSVMFNDNAGGAVVLNSPDEQTVASGEKSVRPSVDPSRAGHSFGGWYADKDCTEEFDFAASITARTVIYAKWIPTIVKYDVTFDLNYADAPSATVIAAERGIPVTRPGDPARSGYEFLGWYTTDDGAAAYNFSSNIMGAVTVYAKWVKVWTVTFNLNYPDAPASTTQTVRNGMTATEVSPSRDGDWAFGGWYNESECTTEYEFGAVTADKSVYADWIDTSVVTTTYTVTFDLNYPGAPASPAPQSVLAGTVAVRPPVPTRTDGYAFKGWYTAAVGGTLYTFGTVRGNISLFAQWVILASYKVDYNYKNAPTVNGWEYAVGAVIPAPGSIISSLANPTRAPEPADVLTYDYINADPSPNIPSAYQYIFKGWTSAPNSNNYFTDFGTATFTGDLTLYAQWEHTYVFEAEYTNLLDPLVKGSGFSGGGSGLGLIATDDNLDYRVDASNGAYLAYLYDNEIVLWYDITSDRATEATFVVRMGAEHSTIDLNDDEFLITNNGVKIEYGSFNIKVEGEFAGNMSIKAPFDDYITVTVQLVEGLNHFEIAINNDKLMGGALGATAPLLDCIRLTTTAKLTWNPLYSNIIDKF